MRMSNRERIARAAINAFREKHGVLGAVLTGPATKEEMEAAREALGHPETHEEWLQACQDSRARAAGEGSP
jgi:hypothetical protein